MQFIFYLLIAIIVALTIITIVAMRYDYFNLIDENKKLKEDLRKARARKKEDK